MFCCADFKFTIEHRNIVIFSVGILFGIGTSLCQNFIQEIIVDEYSNSSSQVDAHAGYYSLGIFYGSFLVLSIFSAQVTNILGAKWTFVTSAMLYNIYFASYLIVVSDWQMYIASVFCGTAAALGWTAQGLALGENSNAGNVHARTSLFWFIWQCWTIIGALFLYFVVNRVAANITLEVIRILYGVFLGCSVCATGIFMLYRTPEEPRVVSLSVAHDDIEVGDHQTTSNHEQLPPSPPYESLENPKKDMPTKLSFLQETGLVFTLLCDRELVLMIPMFIVVGAEITLSMSVYPTALGFTDQLTTKAGEVCASSRGQNYSMVALHMLMSGCGELIGAPSFGYLSKKFGRRLVFVVGCVVLLIGLLAAFVNLPAASNIHHTCDLSLIQPSIYLAMLSSFCFGLADSLLNTLLNQMLLALYMDSRVSQVYALFNLFMNLAGVVFVYTASAVQFPWLLLSTGILSVFATILIFPVQSFIENNPNGVPSRKL